MRPTLFPNLYPSIFFRKQYRAVEHSAEVWNMHDITREGKKIKVFAVDERWRGITEHVQMWK